MNIRVDDTNIMEIAQAGSKVEVKGNVAAMPQEAAPKQVEPEAGKAVSLQQTRVDASFIPEATQIEKIQQAAQQEELQMFQRNLEVVSNTASEKDCSQMEEDGFSLGGTEVGTIVTEMDKIKMELAKAGADISVFGDGLSSQQMEELAGSEAEVRQIEAAIRQADLPATEENLAECQKAQSQASSLTGITEEMVKYLVQNELPPTIENLYMAQHSTSLAPHASQPSVPMDGSLKEQVGEVIAQAGLKADGAVLAYSQWMLDNQVPLTAENLRYATDLQDMQLPLDAGMLAEAMAEAIAEGGRPADAVVLEGYSLADRAGHAAEVVAKATDTEVWNVLEKGLPLTIEALEAARNAAPAGSKDQDASQEGQEGSGTAPRHGSEDIRFLTAKRQLEEARLLMTAQANYALLKQGISIETKPLEEVVAQLKALEDAYYKSLLSQGGVPATEENTAVFAEAMGKAQALETVPAYVLGDIRTEGDSIHEVHAAGMAKKAEMERAGTAYETLKTEPRADLGDSIQKAFRNVDSILEDLGLDATEANRRAVRILAYNQMEINADSIAQMKAADQKVQNLFQNLSPAVVLEIIREGINPLELDVTQLNAKAEEIKNRMDGEGEEKFSKFLYKLERHQEITPQERDSYIGIYRLLRQIDKTDGAVVGALARQGADLTIKNLLSAVRTHRSQGVDVSVDESFGQAEGTQVQDLSISQQIQAAYQADCAKEAFARVTPEGIQQAAAQGQVGEMTPEELLWQLRQSQVDQASEDAYYREQLQDFSRAREAEAQILQMLNGRDMPVTAYNIMAASRVLEGRNVFKSLFSHEALAGEIDLEEVKAGILEDFAEAIKTPEEMAKAQEKLAEVAENVMKTMIESPDIRNMDVREMRIMRQQIELGTRLSKEETYAVPVLVADELTNVQLKIVRGKKERGRLDIIFDSPKLGKVAANFQVQPGSAKGYIVSDSRQTIESLRAQEESLRSRLGFTEEDSWEMHAVYSEHVGLSQVSSGSIAAEGVQDKEGESYQVQTKALYGMAKAFLEEIKKLGE